jgi:DNA polymerase V
MFALIDGNNFFVSCERVFQPQLRQRPVVVLSNNDGCAISRSDEAKALGIRMAVPWFQIKHLEQQAGLVALSANFALYGEMSDRMMSLIAELGPKQEIYSIDESFVDVCGLNNPLERSWALRQKIWDWTSLPTCVGLGPTKTLAKLANHIAKQAERNPGSYPAEMAQVCDLSRLSPTAFKEVLIATDVGEVWGIGRRLADQLRECGIHNVHDLAQLDPALARKRWSVFMERIVRELHGQPCLEVEDIIEPKKQIACTRSFGQPVSQLADLEEVVATFGSRAAEKLRRQHSVTSQVLVFIRTSPFHKGSRFSQSAITSLACPSADTREIVRAAISGLRSIYRPGFDLIKAGVILADISPASLSQPELDFGAASATSSAPLMSAMDDLNRRFGRGTVRLGSVALPDTPRLWSARRERLSGRYTTRIDEIPYGCA